MKKNLSRVLALALVLASLLSLTVGASADGTKVVIPNKISRLAAQLPEREAQPTVRTKTQNGEILVRVSGDPDSVVANWLGYGEEPETVELENGLGYVELEGHKYQLGAKWNNKQSHKYYVLDAELSVDPKTGVLGFHDGDKYTWKEVAYKGTVKVGNYEMKIIEPKDKDDVKAGVKTYQDIFPANQLRQTVWAWVYDYVNTDEQEEGKTLHPVLADSKNLTWTGDYYSYGGWVDGIAGLPKEPEEEGTNHNDNGTTTAWPDSNTFVTENTYIDTITDKKTGDVKKYVTYTVDTLYDMNGLGIAYNIKAKDSLGHEGTSTGWDFMVPSYMFEDVVTGLESNGTSNRLSGYRGYTWAWIVTKGPWVTMYDRAGVMQYITKNEENTDYFKTGLAGSTGKVNWNVLKTPGKKYNWYVESVVEEYAEGDIAKAEAVYNVNGELVRYFITYRTGENETYRIKYTPTNKPANGWYAGVDEFTGEDITAYANSMKTWRDYKTGKLTSQVELDWGLTPLKDWTNPPRLTK